jgi:CheY-like chemotaxis protein
MGFREGLQPSLNLYPLQFHHYQKCFILWLKKRKSAFRHNLWDSVSGLQGSLTVMPRHILVVDDDELLRRSLAFNLERAGYRVSTAGDAEHGLGLARRDRPDLVLLDISLPGMDGLEALRQFQGYVGAPVIFLTARRRELDQVVGLELGADDYVTKPFDFDVRVPFGTARSDQSCAAPV